MCLIKWQRLTRKSLKQFGYCRTKVPGGSSLIIPRLIATARKSWTALRDTFWNCRLSSAPLQPPLNWIKTFACLNISTNNTSFSSPMNCRLVCCESELFTFCRFTIYAFPFARLFTKFTALDIFIMSTWQML